MIRKHHVKKGAKWLIWLYLVSIFIISFLGAYIGLKGNQGTFTERPSQPYEEVNFPSTARDQIQLNGWFFRASSDQVAVIVHGWGGHRARLLPLAQFLQRNGVDVLTFDLRGGTGKNTYGLRESGDIAGAVNFLKTAKQYNSDNISVIGVSMGGAAAVDFASKNQFRKLVLLSPIIDISHAKYTVFKNRHFIFPSIYAAGATFVEWLFYGVRPSNPIKIFQNVDEPTFIMHGTADNLSSVTDIYRLRQRLIQRGQANVTFHVIDKAEHTFLDRDEGNGFPLSQKILDFLTKNPPSAI